MPLPMSLLLVAAAFEMILNVSIHEGRECLPAWRQLPTSDAGQMDDGVDSWGERHVRRTWAVVVKSSHIWEAANLDH